MQTYIVQRGDTLYGISRQYGVSIEDIILENNLVSTTLMIGMVLKIPTLETTTSYIVKKGDTLYSISKKYNVSVDELIRINNLNSNVINIGEVLIIPVNGSSNNNDEFVYYTVEKGDSLYSISKKYDVLVDDIKRVNNLNSNLLSIGMVLKIPVSVNIGTLGYSTYIVKSGDSLYSISRKFNMSIDELKRINNLNSDLLSVGQILRVKEVVSDDNLEGMSCYGEGYKEPVYLLYTVKRGDSLYTISRKFGVSIEQLRKLNNLESDNLSIGDVLKIREEE